MSRICCVEMFKVVAYLVFVLGTCQASRILGLLPFQATSHNLVSLPLFEELARRGHDVTVVGFYEPKNPVPNYKTILLEPLKETPLKGFVSVEDYSGQNYKASLYSINDNILRYNELLKVNHAKYAEVIKQKFDVVIMEYFESDLFLAYVSKVGAPFILIHTTEPIVWHRHTLADPIAPSLIPHVLSQRIKNEMDFSERFWNTVEILYSMYYYQVNIAQNAKMVAANYLGPLPPLDTIAKNASLFFVHTHHSLHGSRPFNPFTIEIGGINVVPPKPLPKDLKAIMDSAQNGIVYFSMGSMMKGSSLKPEKRDALLQVFSELKETVLWKYEGDLPNKPPNVHNFSWLPQRDIFAHPNVVLYIGHCGLLGMNEAITEALPIICFPMFGDQHFNAELLKRNEFGLDLDYATFTEDQLRDTIKRVLRDPSFRENAQRVSATFKDRPLSAMDTAVYWTEYVIRHKGAPHLRPHARFMAWWEYYNVDVIAVLLSMFMLVTFLLYKMVRLLLTTLFCRGPWMKVKTN